MNWNAIVDQHGPLVWRTAYRLLGNDADAADCYQETFVAALAVSQREAVHNWPGLLRTLATNHALDRLRRRQSERERLSAMAVSEFAPTSHAAEERELIEWLRGALAELPPMQASAFSLTCIDELSYDEAAAELQTTPSNLGVLLHRARAKLRELLKPLVQDNRA